MIKDWENMQLIGNDFMEEFRYTLYDVPLKNKLRSNVLEVCDLDKPTKIYTGQTLDIEFKDMGKEYYIYFGQGERFPKDKVGFAWLNDEHSIFFFERPFQNKVVKVLKKLLPEYDIEYHKNDVYINGTKNGASLRTGYQKFVGDVIGFYDDKGEKITKILDKSEALSGMIYILRWDDLDDLNKEFKDNKHHQERLNNKAQLSTLSDFLEPKGITREMFIKMLESEE